MALAETLSTVADKGSALVVLVGVTASARARMSLAQFFTEHTAYRTFVPALPLRRGLHSAARWLARYLAETVHAAERGPLDVLAYIAGAAVLGCLAEAELAPALARAVYLRGPVQELVPAAMVARYGRLLACVMGGRAVVDLADGWPTALPMPPAPGGQGLIIEEGVSLRARALGLGAHSVPPGGWDAQRLLPGATAVLRLPESHDQAYTSHRLLAAALAFFEGGRFGTASACTR